MTWDLRRLKVLRASYERTQAEFAVLLGVSTATITYWETGGPIPAMACKLLDRMEREQQLEGKLPELQTA